MFSGVKAWHAKALIAPTLNAGTKAYLKITSPNTTAEIKASESDRSMRRESFLLIKVCQSPEIHVAAEAREAVRDSAPVWTQPAPSHLLAQACGYPQEPMEPLITTRARCRANSLPWQALRSWYLLSLLLHESLAGARERQATAPRMSVDDCLVRLPPDCAQ